MRFFPLFPLLVILLAAIVSCSSKTDDKSDLEKTQQVLRMSIGAFPGTIDPHQVTDMPGLKVVVALMESLLVTDYLTFTQHPAVAESWEELEDGTLYRFTLRENAEWSNGETITAEDFVYAWQRILSPGLGNQFALDYYAIKNAGAFHKGEIDDFTQVGVKALSERLLEFRLEKRDPLFLKRLSDARTAPVHRATVEKFGAIDDPNNPWIRAGNYVGNGPFILKRWELNQIIEVEKNPHYWDAEKITLEKVLFNPADSESIEERLFRSGQIDIAFGGRIPVDKIARYKAEAPDVFFSQPAYATYFYLFNVQKPPFDNVDVRKAFSYAIDKNLITQRITKNGEAIANALSPISEAYKPPQMQEYNPQLAREHLAKAGFPGGKGFPQVALSYNTAEIHQALAVAIQQMWKKELNVDVVLENQEWKVFLDFRQNLQHDIARAGSSSSFADPVDFLDSLRTGHGLNDTGWSNREYDELVESSNQAATQQERYELLYKAEQILLDQLPLIPIFYYNYSLLKSPQVKGFEFNMVNYPVYKGVYLEGKK
ncbi:MAG TPA: peptide ABC transporter substrate-binding protein [Cellvibrio sp.]|nr:peptide ABC transporter substrate-binding protein [Cellvibrio sp.]